MRDKILEFFKIHPEPITLGDLAWFVSPKGGRISEVRTIVQRLIVVGKLKYVEGLKIAKG